MARPDSVDLRARVVRAVAAGMSRRVAAAKWLGLPLGVLMRVRLNCGRTGAPDPKEVDVIEVRRTGKGALLEFEVVVREG